MIKLNWQDAMEFCNDLNYAGFNDWRLPSIEELSSVLDYKQRGLCLPINNPFLNIQSFYYWSSSTDADYTNGAWGVGMGYGRVNGYDKTDIYYVWPVRLGNFDNLGKLLHSSFEGERFIEIEKGIILDKRTGLQWVKDLNSIE